MDKIMYRVYYLDGYKLENYLFDSLQEVDNFVRFIGDNAIMLIDTEVI